jgi:hypothetical protein
LARLDICSFATLASCNNEILESRVCYSGYEMVNDESAGGILLIPGAIIKQSDQIKVEVIFKFNFILSNNKNEVNWCITILSCFTFYTDSNYTYAFQSKHWRLHGLHGAVLLH